jgi:hypothetical protein
MWPFKKKTNPLETQVERAAGVLVRTLPHLHLKCRPYTHIKRKEK